MDTLFNPPFGSSDLTPHGFCLLWQPGLIWLHAGSDAIIGIAYYSIPLALAWARTSGSGSGPTPGSRA